MSVVLLEGFESYGTATGAALILELAQKWATYNMATDWAELVDGFSSGTALQWSDDESSAGLLYPVSVASTVVIGMCLKPGATTTSSGSKFLQLALGSTTQGNLKILPSGYVTYYRSEGNTLGTTSEPLAMGTWTYVELKVFIANSIGTVDIHFNGTSVLSLSGVDTMPSSDSRLSNVQIWPVRLFSWDNIYINDDDGGAPSMLGPMVIEQLLPTGDDTHNWTQSTGSTGYEVVDNPEIEDTTYVSDTTVNTVELWSYADLSTIDDTIIAVQQHTRVNTDGGGLRTIDILCESGVTTEATEYGVTSADVFEPLQVIYPTDPNTSSPWGIAALNAANFGVKVGD